MDFSLREYLGRRPTQFLQQLLEQFLTDDMWEGYFYAVPIIVEILTQRGIQIPQETYDRIAEIKAQSEV